MEPSSTTTANARSLESYPQKDKYMARNARWDWHDGEAIDIVDDQNRVARTLDRWQTLVFHEADGNRTLSELVSWLPSQYQTIAPPPDLSSKLLKGLEDLVEAKLVEFWDRPDDLAYYFEWPTKEQDEEETRRAMKENGLIS